MMRCRIWVGALSVEKFEEVEKNVWLNLFDLSVERGIWCIFCFYFFILFLSTSQNSGSPTQLLLQYHSKQNIWTFYYLLLIFAMLTPPEAFGTVEDGVYRCASIDPFHFAFLDTLGLRTVVVLNLTRPPKVVRSYASERQVDLVHMGLRPWRSSNTAEWMVLSHELIMDALSFVLDVRNHPVLVLDGTNSFIGTLRKAQHWNFSAILSEYRAFSGGKPHYMTELFLELLDIKCMGHTEALRRRESISGMAHAAAAAIAAVMPLNGNSPSLPQASLSPQPSAGHVAQTTSAVAASTNPSSSSINLYLNSSKSSTSLTSLTAAAIRSPSGLTTPRNGSISLTNPQTPSYLANSSSVSGQQQQLIPVFSSNDSPVPSMTREHYSNVLTREDSTAMYDYDDGGKGNELQGSHSRQGRVVVLLPPTEYLPEWFKRQQSLWARDQQLLKNSQKARN